MKKEKGQEAPTIRLGNTPRFLLVLVLLLGFLVVGLLMNVNIGSVSIAVGYIFEMLWKSTKYAVANLFT